MNYYVQGLKIKSQNGPFEKKRCENCTNWCTKRTFLQDTDKKFCKQCYREEMEGEEDYEPDWYQEYYDMHTRKEDDYDGYHA